MWCVEVWGVRGLLCDVKVRYGVGDKGIVCDVVSRGFIFKVSGCILLYMT